MMVQHYYLHYHVDPSIIQHLPHLSCCRSDIEEARVGLYGVENGSVSLGDQFTECETEQDITRQPEFVSLSPPDHNFLLAKSLSEELTQEMRETNSRIKRADEKGE